MDEKLQHIIDILKANGLVQEEVTQENCVEVIERIATEIDSLLYMSLLVDIEEYYDIVLPEEALGKNVLEDVNDFIILLNDEINNKEKEVD